MRRVLIIGAATPYGQALVERLNGDRDVAHVLAVGSADLQHVRALRELMFGPVRAQAIDTVVIAPSPGVKLPREVLRLAERHPTVRQLIYCSSGSIYRVDGGLPAILAEDHPLAFAERMAEPLRNRLEADQLLCAHLGASPLTITVLRLAEIFAPGCGSPLYDYLSSRVCLRPLGYDPMINLLSIEDAVAATVLAVHARRAGIYNVPGMDTLPLSALIALMHRLNVPLPGPLLVPLYALRRLVTRWTFSYGPYAARLHFTGLLDGQRAAAALGYRPATGVSVR
jgi:UDP-glucose 4-epimerase